MRTREVMQLALDALVQNHNWHVGRAVHGYEDSTLYETNITVIKAIRGELAKPEPEPAGYFAEAPGGTTVKQRYVQFSDSCAGNDRVVPLYRREEM